MSTIRRRQVDVEASSGHSFSQVEAGSAAHNSNSNNNNRKTALAPTCSKRSWFQFQFVLRFRGLMNHQKNAKNKNKLAAPVPTLLLLTAGLILVCIYICVKLHTLAGSTSRSTATSARNRKVIAKLPPLPPRSYNELVDFVKQTVHGKIDYVPIDRGSNTEIDTDTDIETYDVFDCPVFPPKGYPREYPVMDVLGNWPIDDTSRDADKRFIHQGICVFDFGRKDCDHSQLKRQILTYRQSELPFVIRNDPSVLNTVERWNTNDYLFHLFADKTFKGEYSSSNHMMYWTVTPNHTVIPPGWKRPTVMRPYTYPEWHQLATSPNRKPSDTHHYIRMDACLTKNGPCDSTYRHPGFSGFSRLTHVDDADDLFDELKFFNPASEESDMYLVKKSRQRGIQCRMGMEGIVSENHCDGDRNFVAVLGGERRYVLSHPRSCIEMSLYPMEHPTERHSAVNWSAPNVTEFPDFPKVTVNEVVLLAGDVLYLPTQWFHHIVSLNLNYQCNTRSGSTSHYSHLIRQCGFHYMAHA